MHFVGTPFPGFAAKRHKTRRVGDGEWVMVDGSEEPNELATKRHKTHKGEMGKFQGPRSKFQVSVEA